MGTKEEKLEFVYLFFGYCAFNRFRMTRQRPKLFSLLKLNVKKARVTVFSFKSVCCLKVYSRL